MLNIVHILWWLLTDPDYRDLLQKVRYLVEENRILRSKLPRSVSLTDAERRRLLKFGKPLGKAIAELISVVSYRTFQRWIKAEADGTLGTRPTGRPRVRQSLKQLVLRLARENRTWGYTRILGEVRKLRAGKIARASIANILKEQGVFPDDRTSGPSAWMDFIRRHAETLYACDFATKRVLTWTGWYDAYFLVFIHVGSRRVWVSNATFNPTGDWTAQQARNFIIHLAERGEMIRHLIRDLDTKFVVSKFDQIFKTEGAKIVRIPPRSPNLNTYAERWIQSLQVEALDKFSPIGLKHLDYLVSEYVEYFNRERPHQGIGNVPIGGDPPPELPDLKIGEAVHCDRRLGGVLKHYYRNAA